MVQQQKGEKSRQKTIRHRETIQLYRSWPVPELTAAQASRGLLLAGVITPPLGSWPSRWSECSSSSTSHLLVGRKALTLQVTYIAWQVSSLHAPPTGCPLSVEDGELSLHLLDPSPNPHRLFINLTSPLQLGEGCPVVQGFKG